MTTIPDHTREAVEAVDHESKAAFLQSLRAPMTYGNWVRDLHPATLTFALLAMATIALSRPGPLWPACTCVAYLLIAFAASVGKTFMLLYGRLALAAGTILFIARAAVLPGENILFQLGGLRVSTESLLAAGQFTLNVLTISGAVILLFAIAPIKKIMLSLEQAGVTPRATFVILSSIQSIVNLGKHTRVVAAAQESRGIELKGSLGRRIRAFFAIISPVFLTGLNEVEERALALDARAFNSRTQHTQLVRIRPAQSWEIALIATALAVAAASVAGRIASWF